MGQKKLAQRGPSLGRVRRNVSAWPVSNAWNPWMGQPKRLTCQEGSYPSGDLLVLKQDRRANAGRKGTTRAQFSPRAVQCPGPGGRFVADR